MSVIVPVYDGARWLGEAIESVLSQTLRELELIVVDDGSTDASPSIAAAAARRDARVRVETLAHGGIGRAENHGLDVARGRVVARLDADDAALPERLARQVAFLDAHPEVGLLGSAVWKIDEDGTLLGAVEQPRGDLAIRFKALLRMPFTHSTVAMRRSVIEAHGLRYGEDPAVVDDYPFFCELLRHTRAANLPERLVKYRVHGASLSRVERAPRYAQSRRVSAEAIRRWAPGFASGEAESEALDRAFGGTGWAHPPEGPEGPRLVARYRRLLACFLGAREDAPGAEVAALRRAESERFLKTVDPRRHRGWPRMVLELSRIDPSFAPRWGRYWARRALREGRRSAPSNR